MFEIIVTFSNINSGVAFLVICDSAKSAFLFLPCSQMVKVEILEVHAFALKFSTRFLIYYPVFCSLQINDCSVCSEIFFAYPRLHKI